MNNTQHNTTVEVFKSHCTKIVLSPNKWETEFVNAFCYQFCHHFSFMCNFFKIKWPMPKESQVTPNRCEPSSNQMMMMMMIVDNKHEKFTSRYNSRVCFFLYSNHIYQQYAHIIHIFIHNGQSRIEIQNKNSIEFSIVNHSNDMMICFPPYFYCVLYLFVFFEIKFGIFEQWQKKTIIFRFLFIDPY